MSEKKYAIVRIDTNCPMELEKQLDETERDAMFGKCQDLNFNLDLNMSCDKCPYGDTKEQLIMKVAQVLFKEKIKLYMKIFGVKTFGEDSLDKKWKRIYLKEALKEATKIIEFLGVKE